MFTPAAFASRPMVMVRNDVLRLGENDHKPWTRVQSQEFVPWTHSQTKIAKTESATDGPR